MVTRLVSVLPHLETVAPDDLVYRGADRSCRCAVCPAYPERCVLMCQEFGYSVQNQRRFFRSDPRFGDGARVLTTGGSGLVLTAALNGRRLREILMLCVVICHRDNTSP